MRINSAAANIFKNRKALKKDLFRKVHFHWNKDTLNACCQNKDSKHLVGVTAKDTHKVLLGIIDHGKLTSNLSANWRGQLDLVVIESISDLNVQKKRNTLSQSISVNFY